MTIASYSSEVLKFGCELFISIRSDKSLTVVGKELYFAINRDILKTRREGDNIRVIFWWEGFRIFRGSYGTRLIQKFRRHRYV
jgi:hypothetical protein